MTSVVRWNPPSSFPTLYLNGDLHAARAQIDRLLQGQPVDPEDLADPGFVLVTATLPRGQDVADALPFSAWWYADPEPSRPERKVF